VQLLSRNSGKSKNFKIMDAEQANRKKANLKNRSTTMVTVENQAVVFGELLFETSPDEASHSKLNASGVKKKKGCCK